eukprot:tig00021070_g17819.t1
MSAAASDSGSSASDWTSSALSGAATLLGAVGGLVASLADKSATRLWASPSASLKVARAEDDIVIPIYRTNWANISQHRLLCFSSSFFYRVNPQGGRGDVRAVYSYANVKRLDVDTRGRKVSIHFFDGAAPEHLQCARLEELVNLLVERCNALRPAVSVHFEKGSTPFAVSGGAPSGARWQSHSPTPSEAPSPPAVLRAALGGGAYPAAGVGRRGRLAGGRVLAAGPDAAGLVGRAGAAADGLAAALDAADPRAFSPVDLSPRGDPGARPSIGEALSAISPRRLPLASPPAPDVSALHACLAQLEGIAPAPAPRAPRVAPFKEAPSPAPAASPGLSASTSPFLSASEEERRAPSSGGGAGGPSTSGGEEDSLRAGSAFTPAAEEADEAVLAPAAPLGKAARRKKKKGQ